MKKPFSFIVFFTFFIMIANGQDKPEGLFINSKAPEFKGTDQHGNEVNLKDLRKKGLVVLAFYQGNWCPYCSKFLKKLQDSLQYINDKGARVVAITPEMKDGITKTVEKTGASFSILHDEGIKMMKAYDVEYTVDEKTAGRYKNGGIDLEATNQKNLANILPLPALYVIDQEGRITYRFFHPDDKKHVSVKEILQNLK